ncbi:Uncharacterised protein [uncultured Avibacterium sp.]|uniref:Uncharacterized protein n=1 Tax=uncultured Avibacterium sp. TaxID=1936169 RepID=A0A486XEH8_9PAST|nr:Uncharacterised protein [uncultured Avibacterium sp.]
MLGYDDGELLAEYTFGDESVEQWKKSLITLYRSGSSLKKAISHRIATLQYQCPGIQLSEGKLLEGKNINGAITFAYYCGQKIANIAPFGESGVTVILADNNGIAHMITQAWRPQKKPKPNDIFGVSQFDLLLLPAVVSEYAYFCNPEQNYPCQFDKQNPASHQYPSAVVELGREFEFTLPSNK